MQIDSLLRLVGGARIARFHERHETRLSRRRIAVTFAYPLIVSSAAERAETLARLVYELLDAHCDTEQLVRDEGTELDWEAHLDYLRNLERAAREILAERVETSARCALTYDLPA